jgi:hypothetical protein
MLAQRVRSVHIICPLRAEADALGSLPGATLTVSGPGPAAMRRHLDGLATALSEPPRLLIVAGVAGGLSTMACPGQASLVRRVRSLGGDAWTPSVIESDAWTVVGSDRLIVDAAAKRDLGSRVEAEIVDMESHVVAAFAESRGWRWAILRGVSDGPDESLPRGLERLVDSEGRARVGAAVARIAREPTILPSLLRLGRRTRLAMRSVRSLLIPLVEEHLA